MNLLKLSIKNIFSRPLSTTMSLILLTLGIGMMSFIIRIEDQTQKQLERNITGIDMVIGAKGSPLQLILSAIFQIDAPTGNIPLSEVSTIPKHPLVEKAIPLSFGDSYEGFHIVGTNYEYPKIYDAELSSGSLWQQPMEVVVGSNVAKRLNLGIGDTFYGVHGLTSDGEKHHSHSYKITGIFSQSNSVVDQLILTSLESVWDIHEHKGEAPTENGEVQDDEKEITAMLITFRNPMGMFRLPRMINEKTNMQAAVPSYEIGRMNDILGTGTDIINIIAITIMVVAGVSIFISLYSNMEERKYELALLRTYGATRYQLVRLVLQEGLILTVIGMISGFLLSTIGSLIASGILYEKTHLDMLEVSILKKEIMLIILILLIGIVASLLPAIKAFNVSISKTLSDE